MAKQILLEESVHRDLMQYKLRGNHKSANAAIKQMLEQNKEQ